MARLPNAVLFDLDDTIIAAYSRADLAWAAVLAEFAGALAPLHDSDVATAILHSAASFWSDEQRHGHWRQKLREARREVVGQAFTQLARNGKPVPDKSIQNAIADRFSDYRNENMRLFPDAHATIDMLKANGVRLALVTNGASNDQRAKVERFELKSRFHHIQIEGEHGFGKPQPRAYHHAMSMLGVGPRDTWIVGDNLEWEVAAPQRLGIHAIWYDPAGTGLPEGSAVQPDRIIRTLSELLT
jgi:putative hydrolase of the HAD superfamily